MVWILFKRFKYYIVHNNIIVYKYLKMFQRVLYYKTNVGSVNVILLFLLLTVSPLWIRKKKKNI